MAIILMVDDEPDACQLMERLLSASGHEVHAFTDAEAATSWLGRHIPDLAILDIRLRGADGISVLEFIRNHRLHTKVMMITGYPSAETARKAAAFGADDYLVKPVEISELEDRVSRALETAF